jgi:hypothetical protein
VKKNVSLIPYASKWEQQERERERDKYIVQYNESPCFRISTPEISLLLNDIYIYA